VQGQGAILFLGLAPSAYYAYLAIHILSAVIWVGGGGIVDRYPHDTTGRVVP
jgi:hypothetical protein